MEKAKELALQHFEKPIVAICLVLFGWYMYTSLTVELYDKKPQDFVDVTQRAKEYVNKQEPKIDATFQAPAFDELADEIQEPISVDDFRFRHTLRRPFNYGRMFRSVPNVLRPDKPEVQSNRGAMLLFAIDANGKRQTRQVPLASANFARDPNTEDYYPDDYFSGGDRGQEQSQDESSSSSSSADYPEEYLNEEYGREAGGSDLFGGSGRGPTGFGPGGGRNPRAAGPPGNPGSSAQRPGNNKVPAPSLPPGLTARPGSNTGPIITGDIFQKKEEVDPNAANQTVEEYIPAVTGKHWVEVVASFPHEEQIREYVKALRQPPNKVLLRYAHPFVQRRELLENHEWSGWKNIDMHGQYEVVANAVGFLQETKPEVVLPGLCMNIPFVYTPYREPLLPSLLRGPGVPAAQYTNEEWNVQVDERKKTAAELAIEREFGSKKEDRKETFLDTNKTNRNKTGPGNRGGFSDEKSDKQKILDPNSFDNHHEIRYAMIRFWDFTVETDRRYQYQIKIRLLNPNFKRTDVADPSFANELYLDGEWSEPSDEVYVEKDVRWYVGDYKTSVPASTRADLEVHAWYLKTGEWMTNTFTQRLGDIIGRPHRSTPNEIIQWDENSMSWNLRSFDMKTEFDTDNILIDLIYGGRHKITVSLSKGGAARDFSFNDLPLEAVSVNNFGDLIRKNEYVDRADPVRNAVARAYSDSIASFKSGQAGAGFKGELNTGTAPGSDTNSASPNVNDPLKPSSKP